MRKIRVDAIILGILTGLSFAPVNFYFAYLFSLPLFYHLIIRSENAKESFFIGLSYGYGFFLISLHWIIYSFFVDIKIYFWLIPIALTILPLLLALYFAVFSNFFFYLMQKHNADIFNFAALWVIFEFLRGNLFTGFPWNLIGYNITFINEFAQITSIFGIYGLSFLNILVPLLIYKIITNINFKKKLFYLVFTILICSSSYLFGKYRLLYETEFTQEKVLIVQPNISQHEKWDEKYLRTNLEKLYNITKNNIKDDISLVIWPESAFAYALHKDSMLLKYYSLLLKENSILATGAVWVEGKFSDSRELYNSIVFINHEGKILHRYDKFHLLPFGEYVPFSWMLPFDKFVPNIGSFMIGKGLEVVKLPNLPVISPIICYESIFSSEVVKNHEVELLLNVTNDGWFYNSSGPYQHFEMSRIRAIEEGLPLIRSANTGISAIIDSYGRIIEKTAILTDDVISSYIPKPIDSRTFFSYTKNYLIILLMFLMLFRNNIIEFIDRKKLKIQSHQQ